MCRRTPAAIHRRRPSVDRRRARPTIHHSEFVRNGDRPPAVQPYWAQANKPQPSPGINGPELMALMRQQAINFGTRVITEDILRVDLQRYPFILVPSDTADQAERPPVEALTVIIATGA